MENNNLIYYYGQTKFSPYSNVTYYNFNNNYNNRFYNCQIKPQITSFQYSETNNTFPNNINFYNSNYGNNACYTDKINLDKLFNADKAVSSENNNNNIFLTNYNNKETNICGIKNYNNNCYFNSGLQILASCNKFVEELKKYNSDSFLVRLIKEAVDKLLNEKKYDPLNFLNYYTYLNKEFLGVQSCSQNFIRTLLRNLNKELLFNNENRINLIEQYKATNEKEMEEFKKFICSNNFSETSLLSIFSGITKSHSFKVCQYCNNVIDIYSFNYFIDQNIYLDEINQSCEFKEVLKKNFEKKNNLTMNCPNPNCFKEIKASEETKIIKLPEVLIFTLERYQGGTNNVEINPNDILDMNEFIDLSLLNENTKYELFAINIRLGETKDFGHEICQVKRNGKWFEINDEIWCEKDKSYYQNSYGLFYQRKKN